jgi:hypothetical protein
MLFQPRYRFGQVRAPKTDAKMVVLIVVHCSWQQQYSGVSDQSLREAFNTLSLQPRERNRASSRRLPYKQVRVTSKEPIQQSQIVGNAYSSAADKRLRSESNIPLHSTRVKACAAQRESVAFAHISNQKSTLTSRKGRVEWQYPRVLPLPSSPSHDSP